jgi:hypothetical protein
MAESRGPRSRRPPGNVYARQADRTAIPFKFQDLRGRQFRVISQSDRPAAHRPRWRRHHAARQAGWPRRSGELERTRRDG